MAKTKSKPNKTTPAIAIGAILNGALENLKDAGIPFEMGWNFEQQPFIQFPTGVHLCVHCGKFSAGEECQHDQKGHAEYPFEGGES